MKSFLKFFLPILVVAISIATAVAIIKSKPAVETKRPQVLPPRVRVMTAHLMDHTLIVKSQGTVSPRTESQLVPEVSGRVIKVSPSFNSGGFFEEGEILFEIDRYDFEQAVVRARSSVAESRLRLAQEEAEAALAREEWKELGQGEEASPLTLRVPQVAQAQAALESAEAAFVQAERDLERTRVRAPFAGRVRQKMVDVGQYVSRGTAAATVYAVDYAEIRLPLPDRELAFLKLPMMYRGSVAEDSGPRVVIKAEFAGAEREWEGRIVRTEGEIDRQSRMVHVVAQVDDPYGRDKATGRPPLAVGMYVQAEIEGFCVEGVVVLPRAALRRDDQVWVVDEADRLRFRKVDLLRATRGEVVIRSGLAEGERVCLSPMEAVTDGMEVRVAEASGAQAETPLEGDDR
ncbi:MAG: efflux RND transporter periplasmic adaptor subunit [Planctomycetota bacterium]